MPTAGISPGVEARGQVVCDHEADPFWQRTIGSMSSGRGSGYIHPDRCPIYIKELATADTPKVEQLPT